MHNLIIFREERQAQLLKKGLKYQNMSTDIITTCEKDAIVKTLKIRYDAIIIKNTPPTIDAFEICKNLRTMHPNIPILIFDPHFTKEKEKKAFKNGATAILTPPLSFNTLSSALKQLEINKINHSLKPLEIKNKYLRLDLETRQVKRCNRNIQLRNKEFTLLEFLMRNVGKILSRNTILEHVWDHNINILTNTVDVHISNLRKKIDGDSKKKIIETIHCVGYRLNDR